MLRISAAIAGQRLKYSGGALLGVEGRQRTFHAPKDGTSSYGISENYLNRSSQLGEGSN